MIDATNIELKAQLRGDGSWYITSPTLEGFRYLMQPDEDMANALRTITDLTIAAEVVRKYGMKLEPLPTPLVAQGATP